MNADTGIRLNIPMTLNSYNQASKLSHRREPKWQELPPEHINATCLDLTPGAGHTKTTLVYPIEDGIVQYAQEDMTHGTSAGNFLRVRHYFDTIVGDELCLDSLYSHLRDRPRQRYNTHVCSYEPINYVGNTGGAGITNMSVHLHLEIHYIKYPDLREPESGRVPLPVLPVLLYGLDSVIEMYPSLFA